MNKFLIIVFVIISTLNIHQSIGQALVLPQFETSPTNLNPSLSGDFLGELRILTTYRNQWRSILNEDSYRTKLISFDSKIPVSNVGVLGYGLKGLFHKAGATKFQNNKVSISSSYLHNLSKRQNTINQIGLGFEIGLGVRSIEVSDPTIIVESPNYFPDIGGGVHWRFQNASRLKIRIGYSIFHLNKPNISFSPNNKIGLIPRMNLHGDFEIPIFRRLSLLPSFNFSSQHPHNEKLIRVFSKYLLSSSNEQNWIQFGVIGKFGRNEQDDIYFGTYGFGGILQMKKMKLGFSIDHHKELDSNSFEFVLGYIFDRKKLGNDAPLP